MSAFWGLEFPGEIDPSTSGLTFRFPPNRTYPLHPPISSAWSAAMQNQQNPSDSVWARMPCRQFGAGLAGKSTFSFSRSWESIEHTLLGTLLKDHATDDFTLKTHLVQRPSLVVSHLHIPRQSSHSSTRRIRDLVLEA